MVTELKEITGSNSTAKPNSTRDVMYRVKLSSDVVKCIGGFECVVSKTSRGFLIKGYNFNLDCAVKRQSKITTSFTLNLPKRLVDEWNDKGVYKLEFDYENNCVELVKAIIK